MRIIYALLFLIAFFVPAPSHAWLIYYKPAFHGRVIDAETKEPIEGAAWHLENWLRSIRHWYNGDTSVFEYKELKHQGIDGVLEVALLNYKIEPGNVLLIQVKLVEP